MAKVRRDQVMVAKEMIERGVSIRQVAPVRRRGVGTPLSARPIAGAYGWRRVRATG
jgi:hypothetical protein